MMKSKILIILFSFLFSIVIITPVLSQTEKIKLFQSQVRVQQDGSLIVKETIRVNATGDRIKRGIYRDFPLRYKDRNNNVYKVTFHILGIKRDGKEEPYHTEWQMNGIRIYIGDKYYFLPAGEYSYEITYRTGRQLGFFKDHDELYWNVTGNGWEFPIDFAACTIILPSGVPDAKIKTDAFTGYQGDKGKDFSVNRLSHATVQFQTSRSLNVQEGFTIVVGWPKGYVKEPTRKEKFFYFVKDNQGILIGLAGIALLLFYYLLSWALVGRDPKKGTIIPLFNPPENMSPASIRYIMKMEFDNKCFSAAVINMAVKKYLTIENDNGDYTLHRTGKGDEVLSAEERKLVRELFGNEKSIDLDKRNHTEISYAISGVQNTLKQNYFKKYFVKNSLFMVPGILISALTIFLIVLFQGRASGRIEMIVGGGFMLVWLSGWTAGVFVLTKQVISGWKNYLGGKSASSLASAASMSLFAIPFWLGELFGLGMFTFLSSLPVMAFLVFMIGLAFLFHHLLKAPTQIGRQLMDKIEGFKMYLSVTEKDRMNMLATPARTPELFEKYLPYALALDVENKWAEQFSSIFAAKGEEGPAYHPVWYLGGPIMISNLNSSIGSGFIGVISSSATAPGTSSGFSGGGGGGGSSGGGGGGGGGGGW